MRASCRHGFTLIEISIVLVIIGLIVGGILVGRDLIKAAEIRAQISQIEKLKTAVQTFRLKYNALPGDMPPAQAGNFGFLQLDSDGRQGLGDNNGIIEDGDVGNGASCNGGPNTNLFGGEIMTFWRHLSDAQLIEGHYGSEGGAEIDSLDCTNLGATGGEISLFVPRAKLGGNLAITVISGNGASYFAILPIATISDQTLSVYTIGTTGMTPLEAQNIDGKMDDGLPETGRALALGLDVPVAPAPGSPASLIGGAMPSNAGVSTANTCVIGTGASSSDRYNVVAATGANEPSCGLAVSF